MQKVLISRKSHTIVGFVISVDCLQEIAKEINAESYSIRYDINDVVLGVQFDFENQPSITTHLGNYIYTEEAVNDPYRRYVYRVVPEINNDIFDFTIVPDE